MNCLLSLHGAPEIVGIEILAEFLRLNVHNMHITLLGIVYSRLVVVASVIWFERDS